MAGPGIRYRELARVLACHFEVILAVPDQAELDDPPFVVWPYQRDCWDSLARAANRADVIVACGDTLTDFPALAHLTIPLVVDGYDPHTLETLALWAGESLHVQAVRHDERLAILRHQCQAGDFFICASERQRDWWLGLLESHGRINPHIYGADPSLRRLIDVVPYGLPSGPPQATRPVLRSLWPGIGPDDRIVLWGGGLWEWLDPLTALHATRYLADDGYAIRLVFPGTRHPSPAVPEMPLRARTLALADELELSGRYAFFGDWVPFGDWPTLLLEAEVGLSLHPDTAEARLAFRSRILDYIWAGLPMVVTRGDATADLVARYDLGLVADFGDAVAVAEAIAHLLNEARGSATRLEQFDAARRELTWERAAEPLIAFCREPYRAPDKAPAPAQPWMARTEQMNAKQSSLISVIVLTWNGAAYVEECLVALLAQDYPAFEVIVVDNGSSDGTPDLVAERFPGVKLVRNSCNLGFAAGNNAGLQAARGDLLVLLNQDTEVHRGWLTALAQAFDDPAIGIAGCKLLYPDDTIQHAGGYLYGPRGESDHVGRHAPDDGRFDQLADADFVSAAALAIRRTTLQQIGPLDEEFAPAYYEDVDWCYRARTAGFRVIYQPRAVVTHLESATKLASHERKFALHQGRLRFLFKHRPLGQLLTEFGPTELAWVSAMDRSEELMAARRAYLSTLLALSGILAFRNSSQQEANALASLLTNLRSAAMTSLTALMAERDPSDPLPAKAHAQAEAERVQLLKALRENQAIREQPFASQVPLLGRLIVAIRNGWNSVAAKWYVRPMIHQQSIFNAQVVDYLEVLQQHLTVLQQHMQGQFSDVAENIRELTAVAERLSTLHRPAEDPETTSSQQIEEPRSDRRP